MKEYHYNIENNKEMAYLGAALCSMLSLGFALVMIYPGHNWGGDFSQYIAQARALVEGNMDVWYKKNLFIIENSCDGLGATVYPWGFPLLLAPLYAVFGENILAFKILEIIFFAGSVFTVFLFLKKRMSFSAAIVTTLLIGLNPVYLGSTDSVISDIPCMFFSILAIYFIELHLEASNHHVLYGVLAGLFIFMAVQIRTMALVLLLALACVDFALLLYWLIFQSNNRSILSLKSYNQMQWYYHMIPYMVYATGTLAINCYLPKAGGTYWDYFSISLENVKEMIKNYYHCFREFFGIFFIVFLILAVIGIIRNLISELYIALYVIGTVLMLLIYNYYQRTRFLFSVFPFFILFSYYGIKFIYECISKKIIRYIAMTAAFFVVFLYVRQSIKEDISVRRTISEPIDAYSKDAEATYAYINQYIDDDSVIYFFKPRVLYLQTNVYSYTGNDNVQSLGKEDYILFWCNDFQDSIKNFVSDNENYELIYANNQFMLYECK